jgi:hypothetical protein
MALHLTNQAGLFLDFEPERSLLQKPGVMRFRPGTPPTVQNDANHKVPSSVPLKRTPRQFFGRLSGLLEIFGLLGSQKRKNVPMGFFGGFSAYSLECVLWKILRCPPPLLKIVAIILL